MKEICNKTRFIITAVLITTILAVGYPAAARYDELILSGRVNNFLEATGENMSNEMYVVKRGDCLWQLSVRYGLTVEELRSINGMERESSLIREGQSLWISSKEPVQHLVKKGETLIGIASNYNVTVSELTEKNKISDASQLYEGQRIVV